MARLRMTYMSPGVEALCAVHIRLPRCVAGAKWNAHLKMVDGRDCHEFSERGPLPKAQAWSWVRRATTDMR